MRLAALLVLVCACDQAFGVRNTHLWDAGPAVDAPFACPGAGTAPVFSKLVHQVALRNCVYYSLSEPGQQAAADNDLDAIVFADPGGALGPTNLVSTLSHQYLEPHLSAEGDELWIHELDFNQRASTFSIYRRDATGQWIRSLALPGAQTGSSAARIAGPTARASGPRRSLVSHSSPIFGVDEYVEDASGTWSAVATHDATELGVSYISGIAMSRDGLRVILQAQTAAGEAVMMYTDRAQVTDPFRVAERAPSVPLAVDAYLTDDCSRVYASGLGWVFYAEQM